MDVEKYIEGLTPELQEKARACKNIDELLALASDENVPVPEEALDAIAGGADNEVGFCRDVPVPPENFICGRCSVNGSEVPCRVTRVDDHTIRLDCPVCGWWEVRSFAKN